MSHCLSKWQVAMLLAAMPEKDQQYMLNVSLDTPARIASVLEHVTVPMAAELLTKLHADNNNQKTNVVVEMKQEKVSKSYDRQTSMMQRALSSLDFLFGEARTYTSWGMDPSS